MRQQAPAGGQFRSENRVLPRHAVKCLTHKATTFFIHVIFDVYVNVIPFSIQ